MFLYHRPFKLHFHTKKISLIIIIICTRIFGLSTAETLTNKNNMTHVLYYDPFKPNQGQVHGVRQYYELQVVSDTLYYYVGQ